MRWYGITMDIIEDHRPRWWYDRSDVDPWLVTNLLCKWDSHQGSLNPLTLPFFQYAFAARWAQDPVAQISSSRARWGIGQLCFSWRSSVWTWHNLADCRRNRFDEPRGYDGYVGNRRKGTKVFLGAWLNLKRLVYLNCTVLAFRQCGKISTSKLWKRLPICADQTTFYIPLTQKFQTGSKHVTMWNNPQFLHMGLSINEGTPKWLVFVRETPIYKWMMSGGTPISGNHHIVLVKQCHKPAIWEWYEWWKDQFIWGMVDDCHRP